MIYILYILCYILLYLIYFLIHTYTQTHVHKHTHSSPFLSSLWCQWYFTNTTVHIKIPWYYHLIQPQYWHTDTVKHLKQFSTQYYITWPALILNKGGSTQTIPTMPCSVASPWWPKTAPVNYWPPSESVNY